MLVTWCTQSVQGRVVQSGVVCTCSPTMSPTEHMALRAPAVCQVRLQAPGSSLGSVGAVVTAVINADGVRGLWKGATPGVVR
jgi:hypothetical protein